MNKILKTTLMAILLISTMLILMGCSQAGTVKSNLQKDADKFSIYRKMTFVNLQTNDLLYEVEGFFSLQTTYSNAYQGQQEIGIIIKTGHNEFKMHYFSIANNVAYVIQQLENVNTDPYYWNIVWYIPIPSFIGG